MHGSPLKGLSLKLSILNFLNIFLMEFEVGHLEEPFFLSRILFCLIKKQPLIYEQHGAETAIFNKNAIKYAKCVTDSFSTYIEYTDRHLHIPKT